MHRKLAVAAPLEGEQVEQAIACARSRLERSSPQRNQGSSWLPLFGNRCRKSGRSLGVDCRRAGQRGEGIPRGQESESIGCADRT